MTVFLPGIVKYNIPTNVQFSFNDTSLNGD